MKPNPIVFVSYPQAGQRVAMVPPDSIAYSEDETYLCVNACTVASREDAEREVIAGNLLRQTYPQ
jgi:hypothetical protein